MRQTQRRRTARSLGVALAAIVAIANSAGLVAALGSGAVDEPRAQPIAIPLHRTTCAGRDSGERWPADTSRTIIPIGKECPLAASWLGWDDGHGAEAGHDADPIVDWILQPEPADSMAPSWQRVLPGRSLARLRDAEAALNTWAGKVIYLPMFDRTRGSGDRLEVHVVAVLPFLLQWAYLASGDPACGADPLETCLVGSLLPEPPSPTPTPSASPTPTPSGSPSASASPTPNPSPTATPSGSPSASASPTPNPSPTATPRPTATSPPDPVLALHVPGAIAIPLRRGEANRVEIQLAITSDLPWSVCVEDASLGQDRGHMVREDSEAVLARPMLAGVAAQELAPLDQLTCVRLITAADDGLVRVAIEQEVGTMDRPGLYRMRLVFRVIAGF